MCRFVLYMGPPMTLDLLTTRPSHSLIRQSHDSRLRSEPMNADGFGLAWYVPRLSAQPGLFRSIQPAWNDENLWHLSRVTESSVILAHVRAASPGLDVSRANCHPFIHQRLAFMHNGKLAGFRALRRRLMANLSDEAYALIAGSTDSELVFACAVDGLAEVTEGEPVERLAAAVGATIAKVVPMARQLGGAEPSTLNLTLTDGDCAVVTRYADLGSSNSLFSHTGSRYVYEGDGRCRMVEADAASGSVIVASEPLSEDAGWDEVPHNHMLLIRPDRTVEARPIAG